MNRLLPEPGHYRVEIAEVRLGKRGWAARLVCIDGEHAGWTLCWDKLRGLSSSSSAGERAARAMVGVRGEVSVERTDKVLRGGMVLESLRVVSWDPL